MSDRNLKAERKVVSYNNNSREENILPVAVEAPVHINLNGRAFITLQCSPSDLEDLTVGYFITEAVVRKTSDITSLDCNSKEGTVDVVADIGDDKLAELGQRASFTTGCGRGVTFSSRIDITDCDFKMNMMASITVAAALKYMHMFVKQSELYGETRGVHSAAICQGDRTLAFADDVGRHNAVDKVIGKSIRSGLQLHDTVLLCSGRPSFDIVLKCLRAGVPILITRGTPTSLAVDVAESGHLSLLQVRGQRLKVYSGFFRVQ